MHHRCTIDFSVGFLLDKKCHLPFRRTMKSTITLNPQPRSVALGDLNNDQNVDIVVANSGNNTIGIFFSKTDGTFQDQQLYSTGLESRPYSVVVNHFNNDTYLDIAVANYGINNIKIFFGNADKSFIKEQTFSLGSSRPYCITTADFNKDNRMDIATANYGTDNIGILLGGDNGHFQDPLTFSTAYDSRPCSLAVDDLNNDGQLDIVVANCGTNNIGIFFGYGNGTFRNQETYTTLPKSNPSSVTIADFNNDNQLDIAVANNGTGKILIFLGYGNGSFQAQTSYSTGLDSHPQFIAVGKLDEDNILDLIVVDSENDWIHILLGYGNGSFAKITTYDAISDSSPLCTAVSDFNQDNRSDIVVVAKYGTYNVFVLIDYFIRPSARQVTYPDKTTGVVNRVTVGDLNNDQILDIIYAGPYSLSTLIGSGSGTFDEGVTYRTINNSRLSCMRVIDVNNDNQTDIVVANTDADSIGVFLGYGNGTFTTTNAYSTGENSKPYWIAVGDFNHDNIFDIVSANYGSNTIGVLLGNGDGAFLLVTIYPIDVGFHPLSVAVGELNNDKYLDIVVVNEDNYVVVFLGFENGTFKKWRSYFIDIGYILTSVALADFNNDHHQDIVVTNYLNSSISIFFGYGDGTFTSLTNYSIGFGGQPQYVIVADFNSDNISDLAISNTGAGEIVIFHGYSNGSFTLEKTYSTGFGSSPTNIIAADLNDDKQLEIVVALLGIGAIGILTEYDAAEFVNQRRYYTGSAPQPYSVATATFNNDNQSHIVVANSGTGNLNILRSLDNGVYATEIIYSIGSDTSPQYVVTCDINRDDYMDIVCVNSKDNSISVILAYGNGSFAEQLVYSTQDYSHPYSVVCSDLNNDTWLDLIITNEGSDGFGIFMGFDYTSFPSRVFYSSMDNLGPADIVVSDFNNDSFADIVAVFYESHTLGILLGYSNGRFSTIKSYSTGHESGPWKLAVGDFDSDHRLDIVVANYDSSSVGVLLGYGNGSFASVMTYSTGDMSRANDVAIGDLDGDGHLDIVVANYGIDNVGVLLGYGNGTFATIQTYSTGVRSRPISVTVADLNQDNQLDIIVANYDANNIGVLLGLGNGTFENQNTFPIDHYSSPYWIITGDFNNDNQLDIATALGNEYVGVLFGYKNGNFSKTAIYSVGFGSLPSCVDIADFNNDNISDIVVTHFGTGRIVVLFGMGDERFLLGGLYSTGSGSGPYAVAVYDFNNDGRLDLAVANYQSNNIALLLGHDSEPFGSIILYGSRDISRPHSVAIGDFNTDGRLDVVLANYGSDNVCILFGSGDGDFNSIKIIANKTGSRPYFVVATDINNDQYMDIIVSYSESDQIAILLGSDTGTFPNQMTYSTGYRSRPYTIAIADLDKDNKLDIIVANSGTSNILIFYGYDNGTFQNETTYSLGYEYHPYSIAVTDLNGDGWLDIAVACYNTDHIEIFMQKC